jgi:predicted nucleic acid-binding protein
VSGNLLLDTNIVIGLFAQEESIQARLYGRIKKNLRDKGKPLPEYDIWIAALA